MPGAGLARQALKQVRKHFIAQTYRTLSVAEQAERLHMSASRVTAIRQELIAEGRLDLSRRKCAPLWSLADQETLRTYVQEGRSNEWIAKHMRRGVHSVRMQIFELGGIDVLRQSDPGFRAWSQTGLMAVLNVSDNTLIRWRRLAYLVPQPLTQPKCTTYSPKLIYREPDVRTALANVMTWAEITPRQIGDPILRQVANETRAGVAGQWVKMRRWCLDHHMHDDTVRRAIREGRLGTLAMKIGQAWWIWDGPPPPLPVPHAVAAD